MHEEISVAFAWFEPLEALGLPDGTWPYQVHVVGTGFVPRAVPIVATVGDVNVEFVRVNSEGGGFSGLLRETPAEGSVLSVGYVGEPMIETAVKFHQGNA